MVGDSDSLTMVGVVGGEGMGLLRSQAENEC